jgi:hypothetical protein
MNALATLSVRDQAIVVLRSLLTSMAQLAGQRFGDRPAVAFELLLY